MTFQLSAAAVLAVAGFSAAQAFAAPVALTRPGADTVILQMAEGPDNRLCIVGTHGAVILFDSAANRVVWEQMVALPAGARSITFKACHVDGKAVYAAAEVIPAAANAAQGMAAWVYRFDDKGAVTASKQIDSGAYTSTVYAIEADGGAVTVAGAASDVAAGLASNAIYVARLDAGLQGVTLNKLPTGAYRSDAVARLAGGSLFVAGQFAPASHPDGQKIDDYAMSRIVAGKYRFSVRPVKRRANGVAAAITPANDIVALGNDGKLTQLAATGADGRPKEDLPVKSSFCWTDRIGADATTVYAIRTECSDPEAPSVLTAIERRTGMEVIVSGVIGEPVQVLALPSKLAVVARKKDGSLWLQVLDKGQEPD